MLKKITHYFHLFTTDRSAFRFQLWMVWNRYKINTTQWLFNRYASLTSSFLTVHERPVSAAGVQTWSDFKEHNATVAIVLQGPLLAQRNFTLETVRLYKHHYPQSPVIVSIWNNEPQEAITALEAAGAIVVTSEKPPVAGIGNVNLQLVTTAAGIKKAKELGAEFVYKTRCDQRMYAPNLNDFFYQLLHNFPVATGYQQKYRIAGVSFGTLKYVPYLFTDVFQFGHIDDMLTYWSAPHDPRNKPSTFIRTVADLINERMCEVYLCSSYLERIGRPLSWSVADSWRVFADHFVIADTATVDLFFYKYNFYIEHRSRQYHGIANDAILTFRDWLILYNNPTLTASAPTTTMEHGRSDLLPSL